MFDVSVPRVKWVLQIPFTFGPKITVCVEVLHILEVVQYRSACLQMSFKCFFRRRGNALRARHGAMARPLIWSTGRAKVRAQLFPGSTHDDQTGRKSDSAVVWNDA
jgi:hypothetical protein